MLVIRAVIHIMLVRIANIKDPDQTASSDLCLSCFGRQLVFKILEFLQYCTNKTVIFLKQTYIGKHFAFFHWQKKKF